MTTAILLGLVLLVTSTAGQNFTCPKNSSIQCFEALRGTFSLLYFADSISNVFIHITLHLHDKLEVRCANVQSWSKFKLDESIGVGHVKTLAFISCPSFGVEYNQKIIEFLGVSGVEQLEFLITAGKLVREDLAVHPNLQNLTLTINDNGTFSFDLLKDMKSLQLLEFHNNKKIQLPVDFFNDLESLRILELGSNQLRVLESGIFNRLYSLQKLNLSNNDIYELYPEVFSNLSNLQYLDMSFNKLKNLSDSIFKFNSKLQTLDLSNNNLECIDNGTLAGLESLRTLNMENNHLSKIHVNAFEQLKSLEFAKFANNKLTGYRNDRNNSPFYHCNALKELYLAHNNIDENHIDYIVNSNKLSKLDLRYNDLTYLELDEIQFLSKKVHVDVRHNKISRIVITDLKLMPNQTKGRKIDIDIRFNPIHCDCKVYDLVLYSENQPLIQTKKYINLKMENLSCVTPSQMSGLSVSTLNLSSLACLIDKKKFRVGDPCSPNNCDCYERTHDHSLFVDCANRNLTEAPIWIDSRNFTEVELDLINNQLKEVPSMYNKGYEKVTSLKLSGNRISSVDEKQLSPNLKTLLLDDNELSTIDPKILKWLSNCTQITKLSLKNNPWSCDCESRDLFMYVKSNIKRMPDLYDIKCSNSNISLSDLSVEKLCSSSTITWNLVLVLSLLLCLLGLFLSLGIILSLRFRQRQKKVEL